MQQNEFLIVTKLDAAMIQLVKKMFLKKSSKEDYMMTPNCGIAMYTVLVARSEAGECLPPQFLFKGKYLYESWTALGPVSVTYAVSESGWITDSF